MMFEYLGKVRVFGPGIEHGVLSTFQSNFTCETKGAGKILNTSNSMNSTIQ
jgi:hypothetical protein